MATKQMIRGVVVHLALWRSELMLVLRPWLELSARRQFDGSWQLELGPIHLSWYAKRIIPGRLVVTTMDLTKAKGGK